jgi:hypothetical protein
MFARGVPGSTIGDRQRDTSLSAASPALLWQNPHSSAELCAVLARILPCNIVLLRWRYGFSSIRFLPTSHRINFEQRDQVISTAIYMQVDGWRPQSDRLYGRKLPVDAR